MSYFLNLDLCCSRVEVYYESTMVTLLSFMNTNSNTPEDDDDIWYGYGTYQYEYSLNGKWFYLSEFDILPNDNFGQFGIWAGTNTNYWIIGEGPYRGQDNGLPISSLSDICITKDTSNWNFEEGLQDQPMYNPHKIEGIDIKIRCLD